MAASAMPFANTGSESEHTAVELLCGLTPAVNVIGGVAGVPPANWMAPDGSSIGQYATRLLTPGVYCRSVEYSGGLPWPSWRNAPAATTAITAYRPVPSNCGWNDTARP